MEFDKTVKITPTAEWMKKTYDELNKWLFNGVLGKCKFKIFTEGIGSQGHRLGFFHFSKQYRYDPKTRKMYSVLGRNFPVDRYNIYDVCGPEIKINGNYKGTEYAFASILLHEMCHYYTYMNGVIPRQGHGVEFKEIGARVGARSNGYFKIQTHERPEVLSQLELSKYFVDKSSRREDSSFNRAFCMLLFMKDGTIRLVKTTQDKVKEEVMSYETKRDKCVKIIEIRDINFTNECHNNGYMTNCRTYRFWPVNGVKFVENFENYNHKVLYEHKK